MSDEKDVPGVIVFPPLIPLAVLVVGVLVDWLWPVGLLDPIPRAARIIVGVVLFAPGLATAIAGDRHFERIGTNVNPMRPALRLATEGIFAHIRNPMYFGMALGVLSIVVGFALEWTFVALIVGALVMHFGVVRREERYLERKFGDDYRRYKANVPRYGWKF
ncbi:MAG: methyltransferase family protein [Propylenella sp.]